MKKLLLTVYFELKIALGSRSVRLITFPVSPKRPYGSKSVYDVEKRHYSYTGDPKKRLAGAPNWRKKTVNWAFFTSQ